MADYPVTDRNKVRRVPSRGAYDESTLHSILDSTSLCHVGFEVDGQPYVIPTLMGRDGNVIYLHGSAASRMMKRGGGGTPICLTVTQVDGLVLARSAFHHSMNYRSAVVFGTAVSLPHEEKEWGLRVISEHVLPGRWDEVRPPSEQELKATAVLRMKIESASSKIRTGPPVDEPEDHRLPIWAGVLPMRTSLDGPIPDEDLDAEVEVPASVTRLYEDD